MPCSARYYFGSRACALAAAALQATDLSLGIIVEVDETLARQHGGSPYSDDGG
jgi:hypothetical protein